MTKKLLSTLLAAAMLLSALFVLSATAAPIARGDVDGDGKVSSGDARLALRGSVGLEKLSADFLLRADVDADGELKSSDARTILRASVGLEKIATNPCEHQVDKWEPITLFDGSHAAYHKGVCKVCGEALFADHAFEVEITKPFTCTTPGEAIEKCACGVTTGETVTVPAQHTWEEIPGTKKAATCTEEGSVEVKCAYCDQKKTEILPKGHVPGLNPSCTEPQVCTVCGTVLAPALGHAYKDDASITVTQGIRCIRCAKTAVPGFNDLVNVLKDGNHRYSGFTQTVSAINNLQYSGLMKTLPESMRKELTKDMGSEETAYTDMIRDRRILNGNFNLMGEIVVSRLEEGDVKSITTEHVDGIDFLSSLPDVYLNARNQPEDLTAFKNAEIGPVLKVTVVLPTATDPKENNIAKLDTDLAERFTTIASTDMMEDILGAAEQTELGETEEGAIQFGMTANGTADLTVTFYFDKETNLPIAAHYDDTLLLDCKMTITVKESIEDLKAMQLLLNLTDEELATGIVSGAISLTNTMDTDSFFFFDSYFNS